MILLYGMSQADCLLDNAMINGTKLLNVAGMTRGRRDGILKAEKNKKVVKIGPMHLKGVWYELPIHNMHKKIEEANKKQDPIRQSTYPRQPGEDH